MSKKLRFKPEITRVRLNPEQAVLACGCYRYGYWGKHALSFGESNWVCLTDTYKNMAGCGKWVDSLASS